MRRSVRVFVTSASVVAACAEPARNPASVAPRAAAETAPAQARTATDAGVVDARDASVAVSTPIDAGVAPPRPGAVAVCDDAAAPAAMRRAACRVACVREGGSACVTSTQLPATSLQTELRTLEAVLAACASGRPGACATRPATLTAPRARCVGGDAEACREVASRLASVAQDIDAADEVFFEKACAAGDGEACADLGTSLSRKDSTESSNGRQRALGWLQRACDRKVAGACCDAAALSTGAATIAALARRARSLGGACDVDAPQLSPERAGQLMRTCVGEGSGCGGPLPARAPFRGLMRPWVPNLFHYVEVREASTTAHFEDRDYVARRMRQATRPCLEKLDAAAVPLDPLLHVRVWFDEGGFAHKILVTEPVSDEFTACVRDRTMNVAIDQRATAASDFEVQTHLGD